MRSWVLGLVFGVALGACGEDPCAFHSECPRQHYCDRDTCRQDCREDFDCEDGESCNDLGQCLGPGGPDSGVDSGGLDSGGPVDAGPDTFVPIDAPGVDAGTDAFVPDAGTDASVPGTYLDRCLVPGDCTSGRCVDDEGSTRFCSRTCATDAECASEHVCATGQCVPDDVGGICDEASDCALNLCAGNPMTGVGECTRRCDSAADCPAGFACADAGGAFVCVDIERPCARCSTGLCLASGQGCTSNCRRPSDCPRTIAGLEYTCMGGVCAPNAAVIGDDAIADMCVFTGEANQCRSGICLEDDAMRDVCTQGCGESTGCGEGLACVPTDDGGGGVVLVCQDVTTGLDLGEACTLGPQCHSGLCDPSGFCTRLCTLDRLCPTGLTCRSAATGGSTCQP